MHPLVPDSSVTVRCKGPASLAFHNASYLEISQLLIDSCGMDLENHGSSTMYVVTTHRAKFDHLTVVNSHGSAIYVIDSSMTVTSTQMSQCGFFDYSYKFTYGGAINAYNSNLVISGNTVLSYNSAYVGGAVYIRQGNIYITGNTTFANNVAGFGGGMAIALATCVMASKGQLFINNTALQAGGAVDALHVPLLRLSGTFLHNNAMVGGMIMLLNTTAVAKGILLSENHADITAGGITLKHSA